MTLRNLPEAKNLARPDNFHWDAPSDVLAQWAEAPLAAAEESDNSISILDVVGYDDWSGSGVSSKRVAAALRAIGNRDVVVNINSPGGDMFEGIAIFNQLRAHPAKVTVRVLGWAASAASIIAMAGDEIRMGVGSFMMIHNAWGRVIGNRHDLGEAATLFASFDSAIADVYEARTGAKRADIVKMMDAETFMGASDAVSNKFADLVDDSISSEPSAKNEAGRAIKARRQAEAALARNGLSRSERSALFADMGMNGSALRDASRPDAARDAGEFEAAARQFIDLLKG